MNLHPLRALTGKYAAILLALLLMFILEPLLITPRSGVPWSLSAITLLLLLSSLRALWRSRALLLFVAVLGLAYFLLEAAEPLWGRTASILTDIAGMAFLSVTAAGILTDIFTRDEVTADTVFGASAVYLLIAMFFARAYMLITLLDPDSFAISAPLLARLQADGFRGSGMLHYFSLITLTTVGYGDVSPVAPVARNLAAVQAVIAQLFIAAVIARLVALYTSKKSAD